MLDLLLETLRTFEGVEYLISETRTRRLECYNIKKQPEMNREVETVDLSLELYVVFDEGKYRGSYNVNIHPGTSPGELKKIITDGIYAAGFVRNAYFPLVEPCDFTPPAAQPPDLLQTLTTLQEAFYANDCHKQGHLSYSEFFITRNDMRILNSIGVDVSYTTHRAYIETAVHWQRPDATEIEVSELFRFGLDMENAAEFLKERVAKLFETSKDKSAAQPTPSISDIPVLLSGECLPTFFGYYRNRANAQYVYQQLSTYKEGDIVQNGDGDKITLTLEALIPGSPNSSPYDHQGLPLQSCKVIDNGQVVKIWGDTRFAYYLGTKPTGNLSNMRVTGGTADAEELRRTPHLHLISFSAFQTNPITGDFGSEIRLGYYFDGEKTVPITGGSISGNMEKVSGSLRMTKAERQHGGFIGPALISITGASISGVV